MSSQTFTLDETAGQGDLPPVSPRGTYRLLRQVGKLIYVSGHGPMRPDGTFHAGKVGSEVSVAEAYQHARLTGRFLLSTLEEAGFELTGIEVVKLLGMVNADSTFGDHPAVINGCSDLLIEVLGTRGEHARSAVGVGSLPHNMTVEVEAIFSLLD
jgi:enamine deaminase RidA (YjgF/YER057c/UK114 family)